LREGAYTPQDYTAAIAGLQAELGEVDTQLAQVESVDPSKMLMSVMGFLELLRLAMVGYNHASNTRKQALLKIMFQELVAANGCVARFTPKDGFARFIRGDNTPVRGPYWVLSELDNIYPAVVASAERLRSYSNSCGIGGTEDASASI